MEITAGNLAALFTGFDARFKRAASIMVVPAAERLLQRAEGMSKVDQYPMSGLLGDLYEMVDELYINDIWRMTQEARAIEFAGGLRVKRSDIEDDNVGIYNGPIDQLALQAHTHIARHVAAAMLAGFTTNWTPDNVMVFSNAHVWPGGQAWDNLEALPLTAANFDTACMHLEQRLGPNAEPMGLTPKLLVCGPANRAAAETIVSLRTLTGGGDNRLFQRTDLQIMPRMTSLHWFVVDDNPYNLDLPGEQDNEHALNVMLPKPILADIRRDVETSSQTSADADEVFERGLYRYKVELRYALFILAPWLIQASLWTEDSTTTTAAA